ncbi:MAG: hypothetical protein P8H03_10040 [Emcibacteraceae bacterium]|nr:hypothetical protein [Emcibacteraceae bacterium]
MSNPDGTNREKANDEQIFAICDQLIADEILNKAFQKVGVHDYFELEDYLKIHHKITDYWQNGNADTYLGDLMLVEAIVRKVSTGSLPQVNSRETSEFIEKHLPHRHDDGSLMAPSPATLEEVLEFLNDIREVDGISDICTEAHEAFQSGDRDRIEKIRCQESYLAERFRRKNGYMEKLGYIEGFAVLRDLLSGEYKRELSSDRLRDKIEQSLQFWQ